MTVIQSRNGMRVLFEFYYITILNLIIKQSHAFIQFKPIFPFLITFGVRRDSTKRKAIMATQFSE